MTYLVTEDCIKCKHTTCVSVCPVDCFYEGENMLVINPNECIDCGVCEPECPVDAIVADNTLDADLKIKWYDINEKYSNEWPNITQEKDPPADHADWAGMPEKYPYEFSEEPGQGDE